MMPTASGSLLLRETGQKHGPIAAKYKSIEAGIIRSLIRATSGPAIAWRRARMYSSTHKQDIDVFLVMSQPARVISSLLPANKASWREEGSKSLRPESGRSYQLANIGLEKRVGARKTIPRSRKLADTG